jgi:hypothetical protein
MMSGYHRQPDKTREAEWYAPDGKRFIRTGDVGRFDADGFLTLMDRRKDMIISGGFNVYPSDLEAVLIRHPAVAEAAVVGVASQRWGETPVAFVTLLPKSRRWRGTGASRLSPNATGPKSATGPTASARPSASPPCRSSTPCRAAPSARSSSANCATISLCPRSTCERNPHGIQHPRRHARRPASPPSPSTARTRPTP